MRLEIKKDEKFIPISEKYNTIEKIINNFKNDILKIIREYNIKVKNNRVKINDIVIRLKDYSKYSFNNELIKYVENKISLNQFEKEFVSYVIFDILKNYNNLYINIE